MSEREEAAALLGRAIVSGDDRALRAHLAAHSNLPGPRGNIELALALGDEVARLLVTDPPSAPALFSVASDWCLIDAVQAPAGDPLEFVSFSGVICLGALGSVAEFSGPVWRALAHAAADSRWRMREATAMAVQRLLRDDPHSAWQTLERWTDKGGWLLLRAVAASLAHSEVLSSREPAEAALALHRRILRRLVEAAERSTSDFKTLRQGLGYTVSVVTAALPSGGFTLLEWAARSGDRDLEWIVRSNLKKARLTRRYAAEVERIWAVLDGSEG